MYALFAFFEFDVRICASIDVRYNVGIHFFSLQFSIQPAAIEFFRIILDVFDRLVMIVSLRVRIVLCRQ